MSRSARGARAFDAVLLDIGNTVLFLDDDAVSRELVAAGVDVAPAFLREAYRNARLALDRRATEMDRAAGGPAPRGDSLRGWQAPLLDELGLADDGERGLVSDLMAELHRRHRLFRRVPQEVRVGLDELKARGYRLAAVSNAEGNVPELLAVTGLAGFFEVVLDSALIGIEKPDPRIFHEALSRLGVQADAAAHVGDMFSRDVMGARAAGVYAVLVDEDGRHFAPPDVPRVRTLAELPALLESV